MKSGVPSSKITQSKLRNHPAGRTTSKVLEASFVSVYDSTSSNPIHKIFSTTYQNKHKQQQPHVSGKKKTKKTLMIPETFGENEQSISPNELYLSSSTQWQWCDSHSLICLFRLYLMEYRIIIKDNVLQTVLDFNLKQIQFVKEDIYPPRTRKSTSEWLKNKIEWPRESRESDCVHFQKHFHVAEVGRRGAGHKSSTTVYKTHHYLSRTLDGNSTAKDDKTSFVEGATAFPQKFVRGQTLFPWRF